MTSYTHVAFFLLRPFINDATKGSRHVIDLNLFQVDLLFQSVEECSGFTSPEAFHDPETHFLLAIHLVLPRGALAVRLLKQSPLLTLFSGVRISRVVDPDGNRLFAHSCSFKEPSSDRVGGCHVESECPADCSIWTSPTLPFSRTRSLRSVIP